MCMHAVLASRYSLMCCAILAGFAVSLSTLSFWVSNLIVAQLTPIMLASPLQTFGTFYILAGVNIAGFFFTLLVLPETKVIQLISICKFGVYSN